MTTQQVQQLIWKMAQQVSVFKQINAMNDFSSTNAQALKKLESSHQDILFRLKTDQITGEEASDLFDEAVDQYQNS